MTPQEYISRINELATFVNGDLIDIAVLPPANILLASIKTRIAEAGQNSEGGSIGAYSTKPLYASKETFIAGGFNAQGKRVNEFGITHGDRIIPSARLKSNSIKSNRVKYKQYSSVKPNYKPRKSMYLQGGYKQLRSIQGLRTDIMNFKYRGALLGSYQSARDGSTVIQGFTDVKNSGKRKGLEKRFGSVFRATATEIQLYSTESARLIDRVTRGLLEGTTLTPTIS